MNFEKEGEYFIFFIYCKNKEFLNYKIEEKVIFAMFLFQLTGQFS
ncbi:hypothetical protein SAMN02787108_03226 [Lysinibacillus fusiformis]|nr:hypothetical protein SAMN02787108_03226 [Lysinibacillus fusiformis]SDB46061.1 hypothetical protein SAMN02787070_03421 [Lysinibacillus fusiformis]SFI72201.1 hypothetical protein SAMN02787080_03440 [Lysinibacillus fusiformis]SFT15344.1 hypothetical protein SAMN02787099_03141 [Lysinibacillus fusiformis]